jgi:hypothetical protein
MPVELELVGMLTVTVSARCEHCASPVPVNGPTRRAHCGRCLRETRLSGLGEALEIARTGYRALGSAYEVSRHEQSGPSCDGCGCEIPLGENKALVGAVSTLSCPQCGEASPTFPAPAWLKGAFPTALQVFGADREIAAEEGGLTLDVSQEELQPITMACPACGGGLTVTTSSERTIACEYCRSSAFIPDDLWRRLHPVKVMKRWTLTYEQAAARKSAPSGSGHAGASAPPGSLALWAFKDGALVGSTSLADKSVVKIGRVSSAQLHIDDSAVSRMHAVVESSPAGELTIIDLGSSSGTYVNGRRINKATLKVGDRIYIGKVSIEVGVAGTMPDHRGAPASAASAPAPAAASSAAPSAAIVLAIVVLAVATGVVFFLTT